MIFPVKTENVVRLKIHVSPVRSRLCPFARLIIANTGNAKVDVTFAFSPSHFPPSHFLTFAFSVKGTGNVDE
jgi:hypothetical protein